MKKLLSIFALMALIFCFFAVSVCAADEHSAEESESESEIHQIESGLSDDEATVIESNGSESLLPEDEETTSSEEANLDYILENIADIIDTALEDVKSAEVNDWRTYVEKTLIPAAVTAIAAIVALCIASLPIINKVKLALENVTAIAGLFKKATKDVNAVTDSKVETDKKIDELNKKFDLLCSKIETVEKIERIGFGNIKELVVGGFASEIGKVGKNGEDTP